MPGGRVDHVPVRPLDLAANTLVFGVTYFKALLVIAAVPELLRITAFFANEPAARSTGWWLPNWLMNLVSYGISALVFTGVIRYVVLSEGPSWLPGRQLLSNFVTTAIVLMAVGITIGYITSSDLFVSFYSAYVTDAPFDEGRFLKTYAIYSVTGFFLSGALTAAIYPIFGMTAILARFNLNRLLRWNRKYFWQFAILALILMAACGALWRGYSWLLFYLLPLLALDPFYAWEENIQTFLAIVFRTPLDLLFDIIPAVAIGLTFRVLRANSADL